MNNRFTADAMMQTYPAVLDSDEKLHALGTATAKLMEYLHPDIQAAGIYNRIDELPEDLLDILARDFKIDWYDFDYPIEAKRNLVKTHWEVHKHMGTVGAVRTAIRAVYPRSDVEEWWQDWYQGEPYHFRVILESGYPIIPVSNTDIIRKVGIYKSLRSHLDGVIFRSTENIIVKTKCSWLVYSGRLSGTYPVITQPGSIEGHGIVIHTASSGIGYRNPYTGEIAAGTYPQPAVPGDLIDGDIVVETSNGSIVYRDPYTGEIVSGTYPEARTMGEISEGMVAVRTAGGNMVYRNPATGEIMAGEFPETAIPGSTESGAISATSEGQGIGYTGKVCGDGLIFYH